MPDITHPTVHGAYAPLVTHQAYYYLYGLYADYALSNRWHAAREHEAEVRRRMRALQPLLWRFTPYRKSAALRLFTERRARERFRPELVDEAWRQLRELLEQAGPPPDWEAHQAGRRPPTWGRGRLDRARPQAPGAPPTPREGGPAQVPGEPGAPEPPFLKPPTDYEQDV